jgi:(R)-2-hydroxyacyl-CoA dehydratese activating ATPase
MAGRQTDGPVVFTGGVALVPGMDAALQRALGTPVRVAPEPQITAALGAALLAAS